MKFNTSVWGLDVSKDNVCAHSLLCFPADGVNNLWELKYRHTKAREFNQAFKRYFLYPKKIDRGEKEDTIRDWVKLLKPGDIVVMEPTGVHYAYLWARAARLAGCIVVWVGHAQLAGYRAGKNLPEKSDAADALCLAAYYLDPEHQLPGTFDAVDPRWFLSFDIEALIYPLAQATAYLRHINRAKHPDEAYVKQLLAWQFPEVAYGRSQVSTKGVRPLYAWLAEREDLQNKRGKTNYEKKWSGSIAKELGVEPDWYCRMMADHLVNSDLAESRIEQDIEDMLRNPEFEPYLKIFTSLELGPREFVPLLIAIYPFESFLVNGKRKRVNNLDLSLRAFKHRIGQGGFFKVSGDSGKYAKGGSSFCRQAMWNWVYRHICPSKHRPTTGLAGEIGAYYSELETRFGVGTPEREKAVSSFLQKKEAAKDKNRGGKRRGGRQTGEAVITGLLVAKTQSKLANVLYRELCKEFCK